MSNKPKNRGSIFAYTFPAIIFVYGFVALINNSIWIKDPGSRGEVVVGTQAVLFGISHMIFAYLIYVTIRYVSYGMEEELNPITLTNKILLGVSLLLMTIGGLWEAIEIIFFS
jgi:hypothetical protein